MVEEEEEESIVVSKGKSSESTAAQPFGQPVNESGDKLFVEESVVIGEVSVTQNNNQVLTQSVVTTEMRNKRKQYVPKFYSVFYIIHNIYCFYAK